MTVPAQWAALTEAFASYNGGSTSSALKVSAVFACNDRICKDVSTLPFRPIRKVVNGNEIAKDHDQYFLSHSPSQLYSTSRFFYVLNSHVNLFGNGYAEIIRKNGRPVEYRILHPSQVDVKLVDNRKVFVYKPEKGEKRAIPDDNMIHGMWYTDDGISGKSVLTYARETVELSLNSNQLSTNLYKNQMQSPGYVSYKDELTLEQAQMIGKMWAATTGEAGKDSINVLDRGSEFKNYGMSLKDAEYLGTKEFSSLEIARFFGVPGSKVNIREGNVSYGSLEQEDTAYVQETILPRVIMWEEEFERKGLSESDMGVVQFKFELKGRLRGDMATRSNFYQMGLASGLLSINQCLQLEDINTIGPVGDERFVNGAMVPLSKIYSGELENEKAITELVKSSQNGNGHAAKVQYSRT